MTNASVVSKTLKAAGFTPSHSSTTKVTGWSNWTAGYECTNETETKFTEIPTWKFNAKTNKNVKTTKWNKKNIPTGVVIVEAHHGSSYQGQGGYGKGPEINEIANALIAKGFSVDMSEDRFGNKFIKVTKVEAE